MRRPLLPILVLMAAQIAAAASAPPTVPPPISVAQLLEKLDEITHEKNPDGDPSAQIGDTSLLHQLALDTIMAKRIDSIDLSERLTPLTLASLKKHYPVGPDALRSLELLADRSAFFDPPASEQVSAAPPTPEAQLQLMERARNYGLFLLEHLPNFFATRTTTHFDNDPITLQGFVWSTSPELRLIGSLSRKISFRDGHEVVEADPTVSTIAAPEHTTSGMDTQGEFGAELNTILTDTLAGSVSFHHWEKGQRGLLAVFHYSIPEKVSHYGVRYSCVKKTSFYTAPAYHGSLTLDPNTGVVLRVTLLADWKKKDPVSHIGSVIEYGPVVLGNHRYISPQRSLAFLTEEMKACQANPHSLNVQRPVNMLNRTVFTNYHRMGSSIRFLEEVAEVHHGAHEAEAPPAPAAVPQTPHEEAAALPDIFSDVLNGNTAQPSAVAANTAADAPAEAESDDAAALPEGFDAPAISLDDGSVTEPPHGKRRTLAAAQGDPANSVPAGFDAPVISLDDGSVQPAPTARSSASETNPSAQPRKQNPNDPMPQIAPDESMPIIVLD